MGKNSGNGSATGKNTSNPYKHCNEHPTDPTKIICRRKKDGKKVTLPKPADWDLYNKKTSEEFCSSGSGCQKAATVVTIGAVSYIIYRCVRMAPSLFPPLWPTIPANAAIP